MLGGAADKEQHEYLAQKRCFRSAYRVRLRQVERMRGDALEKICGRACLVSHPSASSAVEPLPRLMCRLLYPVMFFLASLSCSSEVDRVCAAAAPATEGARGGGGWRGSQQGHVAGEEDHRRERSSQGE